MTDLEKNGDGIGGYEKVVDLIGGDLLERDVWGEHYDDGEFRARDDLLFEASIIVDGLESEKDPKVRERLQRDLESIKRRAAALNRLQAYAWLAEESPNDSILRPDQLPFMRDICDFLECDAAENLGGFAVIPTGVGKTVIFNEVIQTAGLRTLVVADTKEQVRQNHDKLQEHAQGREIDAGIVDGNNKNIGRDVTYTTYASLLMEMRKPPEKRLIKPEDYDMLILDEAHLVLGENRRKTLKHFRHAIKMAFTATDLYDEDKQLSILLPHEMSRMTLAEAEERKLVAPHHNILVQTSRDMRHVPVASTGDYAQQVLFESINTDERNLVAVEAYIKLHFGKKTVDFCGGIQHAKDLAQMYNEHDIPAAAVWGDMPDDERERVFKAFREGKLMHVTNADLISTGFDMKSVECVYMLQPSLSFLRTMQIGGRSNRLWEDLPGKVSYVVQFIDESYAQPPVIFAELGAAGSAQHGWDGFVFPEIETSDLPFTVLHDPFDVEFVAMEHQEGRRKRSSVPPEGWANFDELKELSGRPISHIKRAYKALVEEQEKIRQAWIETGERPDDGVLLDLYQNSGLFLNPKTDGGKKKYLSPEMIHRMAVYLEVFQVRESTQWRRSAEVQAIYDRSPTWVNNTLLWNVRDDPKMSHLEALLVDNPESTKKIIYFHFDMYKAGAETNKLDVDINDLVVPPKRMKSEEQVREEIDKKYGEGTYELAVSRSHKSTVGWGNRAGSVVYEVDGERVDYYPPRAIEDLIERLRPRSYHKPFRDLLDEVDPAVEGMTYDQIADEVEALLAKELSLSFRAGLYLVPGTDTFEYYGDGEMLAHVYEQLTRKHKANKTAQEIAALLEKSPVLKKEYVPKPQTDEDVIRELEADFALEQRSDRLARIVEERSPEAQDEAQAKLKRAQGLMKRYRQNRS